MPKISVNENSIRFCLKNKYSDMDTTIANAPYQAKYWLDQSEQTGGLASSLTKKSISK